MLNLFLRVHPYLRKGDKILQRRLLTNSCFIRRVISMQHLVISDSDDGLKRAAELIQSGKLVAFPTETVYGLGANGLNETAVRSVFTAKGRPMTDPLILHVADPSEAQQLMVEEDWNSSLFHSLASAFWPGALTIVVRASACVPACVTANTGFVGIRCPNHPLARRFIKCCGVPIAGPSANRFGHVSPTQAQHVLDDLASHGIHVLDGDHIRTETCKHGIESTVIKLDHAAKVIHVLRQGAITVQLLYKHLHTHQLPYTVSVLHRAVKMHSDDEVKDNDVGQVAPGQALTHYAPDIPCFLLRGYRDTRHISTCNYSSLEHYAVQPLQLVHEQLKHCVVLDYHSQYAHLKDICVYRDLSSEGKSAEAAHDFFAALRWAEVQQNITYIFVAPIEDPPTGIEDDISQGLADRIFRSTSGAAVDLTIDV